MSLDRIERALRQGPPDEPAYLLRVTSENLRGEVVASAPRLRGIFRTLAGLADAVVAIALIVAVAGIVAVRSGVLESGAAPESLLSQVHAAGVVRIAVRPDRPQASTPGGVRSGFDVDVATEIGRRLGLRLELVFTPAADMLAGRGAWDIALPSSAVEQGVFEETAPYYLWPVWMMVASADAATTPVDLSGSTVCVVAASAGEAWLDGNFLGTSSSPLAAAPRPGAVHRLQTDEACAAELASGAASALVTAGWSAPDLASRPALRQVGGAVLTEARTVIAVRGASDPTALIAEVDRILTAMRQDGTLAGFSRSRFGGLDLSGATAP